MKNTWLLILFVLVVIVLIIYSVEINRSITGSIDEKIIISLIGSLTATITIIGSIYVNKLLSNENSKQQRAMENRKRKQEYYHKFTDSITLKTAYLSRKNTKEFKQADLNFSLEKNRLPLYASQELIDYVERLTEKSSTGDFKILFELIRKDLVNDELKEFYGLKKLSLSLPSEETIKATK